MHRGGGIESLPFNAGDEPVPLARRERHGARVRRRPDKVATMQAPVTQPDTSAVPDQKLQARSPPIAKGVGGAVTRGAAQQVLYPRRQPINPTAHVYRFDHHPDLARANHPSSSRRQGGSVERLRNGRLSKKNRNRLLLDPGKPWQNGTNESFNGKFRDECLANNGSAIELKPGS